MNRAKELLEDAKQLIIKKGWTQLYYARNAEGYPVEAMDESAASFCIVGALERASLYAYRGSDLRGARKAIHLVVSRGAIADYNDEPGRTKDEIVALFDAAKEQVTDE